MSGVTFVVSAISDRLTERGIRHRLGGSLAARLHGAPRHPTDVDLEVGRADDVEQASRALINGLNGWVTRQGVTWQVQSKLLHVTKGMFAQVRVRFIRTDGVKLDITADIVNENNHLFNAGLQSPEERGVVGADGSLVSAPELVINYLDRLIQKPGVAIAKNDVIQITRLLQIAGFNPANRQHADSLRQTIARLARPATLPHYLAMLEQVINFALQRGTL